MAKVTKLINKLVELENKKSFIEDELEQIEKAKSTVSHFFTLGFLISFATILYVFSEIYLIRWIDYLSNTYDIAVENNNIFNIFSNLYVFYKQDIITNESFTPFLNFYLDNLIYLVIFLLTAIVKLYYFDRHRFGKDHSVTFVFFYFICVAFLFSTTFLLNESAIGIAFYFISYSFIGALLFIFIFGFKSILGVSKLKVLFNKNKPTYKDYQKNNYSIVNLKEEIVKDEETINYLIERVENKDKRKNEYLDFIEEYNDLKSEEKREKDIINKAKSFSKEIITNIENI
tara:strand:+ start:27698 stop:28558 length:861 start_codon:yes stop_codon:yes gene_type:complete